MRTALLLVSALLLASACGSVKKDPDAGDGDGDGDGDGGNPDAPAQPDAACPDGDSDGVCDSEDICPTGDDSLDADGDSVPDACDVCAGSDDGVDTDADTVPDGCDACAGFNDTQDADSDTVPDGCDVCPGFNDTQDADTDTVPDGCDVCPGFNDLTDTDSDGTADGCDKCQGFNDAADADADTVPNGCDLCRGANDLADADADGIANACETHCWVTSSDASIAGGCYYLNGTNGVCQAPYTLAPQSIFGSGGGARFIGKIHRSTVHNNCCIKHANQAAEGQDYGMGGSDCGSAGPWTTGPTLGAVGCTDQQNNNSAQLTVCGVSCGPNEVYYGGRCYYLDGTNGTCLAGYTVAPQKVLAVIAAQFVGKQHRTQVANNCCIKHRDQPAEGQDWGMGGSDCNAVGPWGTGPQLGAVGCTDQQLSDPRQLTLCMSN